jgi:hypothetical protein
LVRSPVFSRVLATSVAAMPATPGSPPQLDRR